MREEGITARVRTLIWLKSIGSTLSISLFFVAYFYVLNYPVFPVRVMPLLVVDQGLPVIAASAWAYFSLWVYICLPVALMRSVGMLGIYLLGATVMSLVGMAVFYLYPTAVPPFQVDWSAYPLLEFLKESDSSGNACPSLHVGFAAYSASWIGSLLQHLNVGRPWQWGNAVWALLIILSTMTTKQHVFLDVIFGFALGVAAFGIGSAIRRSRRISL